MRTLRARCARAGRALTRALTRARQASLLGSSRDFFVKFGVVIFLFLGPFFPLFESFFVFCSFPTVFHRFAPCRGLRPRPKIGLPKIGPPKNWAPKIGPPKNWASTAALFSMI